jgi:hypothetical protein
MVSVRGKRKLTSACITVFLNVISNRLLKIQLSVTRVNKALYMYFVTVPRHDSVPDSNTKSV